MAKILVVDDEPAILYIIKTGLEKDGHVVTTFENVENIDHRELGYYDLLLLDVMMPGTDGFAFCQQVRKLVSCPILFLTAKVQEQDIVYGLALGADDYITKPFRIAELKARVNAHLRRENREKHNVFSVGLARFDLSAKTLSVNEVTIQLTKGEYAICEYLARNKGQVFTKEQIYEEVFGFDAEGDSATIAVHIKNIRMKLGDTEYQPIETVWGIGYKWV
jgi:Response regulators consisting of a CheY-like receiver domain and a winged-helix DNA-binding domain